MSIYAYWHLCSYGLLYKRTKEKNFMAETLTICRDWGTDNYTTRYFTLEKLLELSELFDLNEFEDGFVEFITGLNCDTYADQACDIMREEYSNGSTTSHEELFDSCMGLEEFQTCYTVFRLWNSRLSPEAAMSEWKASTLLTMEDEELEYE